MSPNKTRRDPKIVSKIMSSIRSKDTSIELLLRSGLFKSGLRFRKHYNKLPGKPDIVFTKQKIAIFLDSDFWHGRDWPKLKKRLNTNSNYWIPKIENNIIRDNQTNELLNDLGWTVLRYWESDIRAEPDKYIIEIKLAIAERQGTYSDQA